MKKLTHAIARSKWAIEVQTGIGLFPRAHALLTGERVAWNDDEDGDEAQPIPVAVVITGSGRMSIEDAVSGLHPVPSGSVGLLNIKDTIMKETDCGIAGSMDMAEAVKQLSAIDGVSSILIAIDSPGGQVDGTATLADAIKASPKRTVALVNDGMACSAAYWIASAANEVYATHAHSEVGSIGVYATLADFSKYYEEKGIRVEDVYAKQSTEKNNGYRNWRAGDSTDFVNRLSAVADTFINTVKENRNGKLNEKAADPFKGAVFSAEEAVQIGLIDGIRSYDAVLADLQKPQTTFKLKFS